MRVLVTGREGQVARSLIEQGPACGHEIVAIGRPELDLADDPTNIARAIERAAPDAVVSAAAYTAVDKAEEEPDRAFAVNATGPGAIAIAAKSIGVPLIHLSTDYVFDGSKSSPYREDDPTGPAGVYGASKLAGEQAVLAAHENTAILRTAWVYSPFGANFVKTMLRLAGDRDEIRVVADQRGNPTSALDIATAVLAAASNLARSGDPTLRGVFHMTGSGAATWAEFAETIFALSAADGGPTARVIPISTAEYPTPARRPANSQLDCSKLAAAHGIRLAEWQLSVAQVVKRINADGRSENRD